MKACFQIAECSFIFCKDMKKSSKLQIYLSKCFLNNLGRGIVFVQIGLNFYRISMDNVILSIISINMICKYHFFFISLHKITLSKII